MKRLITLAATAAIMTATTHAQDGYKLVNRQKGAKLTGWVLEQNAGPEVNEKKSSLPMFTDSGVDFSAGNASKKDPNLSWLNKHLKLRWVGYLDMGETGGDYTFVAQSIRQGSLCPSCELKINDVDLISYKMTYNQAEARDSNSVTLNAGLNKVEVWMRSDSHARGSTLKITYQKEGSETIKTLTPAGLVCEAPIE